MNTQQIAQLQLSQLLDEAALRKAAELYAKGADRRDKALWASLVTADCVIDGPGFKMEGRDQVVASLDILAQMFFMTQHRVHNQVVTISGDTAKGETVPPDARVMRATSQEQVESLGRVDSAALERCVIRKATSRPAGTLANVGGVSERILVGAEPIVWPHGFTISEISLAAGTTLPDHPLEVPDVWFVQQGAVEVLMDGQSTVCSGGDTITLPSGSVRSLRNCGAKPAIVVQVRGGDTLPALAQH